MTAQTFVVAPDNGQRWDALALGEVMLRFDPGEGRSRSARQFTVWEGGGEYNVARGLCSTFEQRTGVLTALPRNELGLLAQQLIQAGGVDASQILWRDYDGIGRNTRMGLNFTERGFGARAPLGISDRAYSAASQLQPEAFDWDALFGQHGVRWLHTGGIFAALSEHSAATAIAAETYSCDRVRSAPAQPWRAALAASRSVNATACSAGNCIIARTAAASAGPTSIGVWRRPRSLRSMPRHAANEYSSPISRSHSAAMAQLVCRAASGSGWLFQRLAR